MSKNACRPGSLAIPTSKCSKSLLVSFLLTTCRFVSSQLPSYRPCTNLRAQATRTFERLDCLVGARIPYLRKTWSVSRILFNVDICGAGAGAETGGVGGAGSDIIVVDLINGRGVRGGADQMEDGGVDGDRGGVVVNGDRGGVVVNSDRGGAVVDGDRGRVVVDGDRVTGAVIDEVGGEAVIDELRGAAVIGELRGAVINELGEVVVDVLRGIVIDEFKEEVVVDELGGEVVIDELGAN